jgi:flagellar FliJ protein
MVLHIMTRSKRMQPVQRLAQNREQQAVRRLGESQQHLQSQQNKLEELRAYRDQYARDFETSGGGGLDAARVQDYRVFLNRLNEAIRQQEAVIAESRVRHEESRQRWVESRSENQAIDKLVDRYRLEESKQRERREQKEQDDRAHRRPDD